MLEVKIPKRIKVGGFTYKVEQGPHINKELDRCNDYGNTREIDLSMRIDTNVPAQIRSGTFIHEMLHCVDAVYNNHQMNEQQIHSMGHGISQVLEDIGVRFV